MNLQRFYNKVKDYSKFTHVKYHEFLNSISNYKIVTCKEFANYYNPDEVVICLRHDADSNWCRTIELLDVEFNANIRSTVFILHTARYYTRKNLIPDLLKIQDYGFEIGLHNDLMSIQYPAAFLRKELFRLRIAGIDISGSAAHGRERYKIDNIHNNAIWKMLNPADYDLKYEAYSLEYNKYFSDCKFIAGHRWHPDMFDWSSLKPGDRVQILIHPEHWHA